MEEIWKPIKNHTGYFISSLGRIKSFKKRREIILKQSPRSKAGYLSVSIWSDDAKKKTHDIHVLVAEAFLNHVSNGHEVTVDHIDNIKSHNNVSNLQLLSNRENVSKNTKRGTSIYTGVLWSKSMNKWVSRIIINKVRYIIGYFELEIEAGYAYQNALANFLQKGEVPIYTGKKLSK